MATKVVQVGKCISLPLTTHAGTGYSWVLTGMPAGLGLDSVTSQYLGKTGMTGGPLCEIFTFVGISPGKGTVDFILIRPWEPDKPADVRSFNIEIVADAEAAMRSEAGNESFLPVAFAACDGEYKDQVMLESSTNCIVKYGALPPESGCVLKYGFPVTILYAAMPGGPIARYMAQPPRE